MTGPVHVLFMMIFDEALPDCCAVVADNQQSSEAGTPKLLTSIQLWIKCDTMQYMCLPAPHDNNCAANIKMPGLCLHNATCWHQQSMMQNWIYVQSTATLTLSSLGLAGGLLWLLR